MRNNSKTQFHWRVESVLTLCNQYWSPWDCLDWFWPPESLLDRPGWSHSQGVGRCIRTHPYHAWSIETREATLNNWSPWYFEIAFSGHIVCICREFWLVLAVVAVWKRQYSIDLSRMLLCDGLRDCSKVASPGWPDSYRSATPQINRCRPSSLKSTAPSTWSLSTRWDLSSAGWDWVWWTSCPRCILLLWGRPRMSCGLQR